MKLKKEYLIRLCLILSAFIVLGFGYTLEANASVGQILKTPEPGWTRYDNRDGKIKYSDRYYDGKGYNGWTHSSSCSGEYKGTFSQSYGDACCEFNVTGSSFRIISDIRAVRDNLYKELPATAKVYVNGKMVGTINCYSFTLRTAPSYVSFEYNFPTYGTYNVKIDTKGCTRPVYSNDKSDFIYNILNIDALDVLETPVVNKLEPVLVVEQPVIGKVYTGSIPISGYALNQSKIKSVTTTIDGKLMHNCTIDLKRNDASNYKVSILNILM